MKRICLKLLEWLDTRLPIVSFWTRHFKAYYVPKNLNFYYCFGVLAIVVLLNQFITGLWLTMFYTPTVAEAFNSIQFIMRDVNYGWLFRYMHTTGASALFLVLYLHLFRGLLYGSYQKPRELVWILGVGLLVILIAESFFGYLLPWGQMSYWGAQVITSLFGAIPYVGDTLVLWIRGDYTVGNATLQRFFALHIIAIPFLVLFLGWLHVVALRQVGSNNPEGININKYLNNEGKPKDAIPFYPYYVLKDFLAILIFLILFFTVVFFVPDMRGLFLEPTNFITANPLLTPEHITPMWYLTPFYAMLRAVSNKLMGVIIMSSALLILIFIPWLDKSPVRSMRYKGMYSKIALSFLVVSFLSLGYLGRIPVTSIKQFAAQFFTIVYFAYFLLMPFYSRWEHCKVPPERLSHVE